MKLASLEITSLKWRMFWTILLGTLISATAATLVSIIPVYVNFEDNKKNYIDRKMFVVKRILFYSSGESQAGKIINNDNWRIKLLQSTNPDFWYFFKRHDGRISSLNEPDWVVDFTEDKISASELNIPDTADNYVDEGLNLSLSTAFMLHKGNDQNNYVYGYTGDEVFNGGTMIIGGVKEIRFIFFAATFSELGSLFAFLLIAAIPFAYILALLITRRLNKSVATLEADLSSVNVDEAFQPVSDEQTPRELQPLLGSFNSTLGKLHGSYRQQRQFARQQRQFATELTHELRTPIAAVMAQLQLLEPSKPNQDMLGRLTQLHGFIGQLLDSDRLRWADEARTRSDLVPLIRDVAAQLAPLAAVADRTISFSSDHPSVELVTDVTAVSHVVHNLIANAIVHGAGEVSIAIESGREPGHVMVTVSDEGNGLTEADISVLSQEFKKGSGNGSGLGLSIASNIMRKLGGNLTGHIGDQKTEFTLALPTGQDIGCLSTGEAK